MCQPSSCCPRITHKRWLLPLPCRQVLDFPDSVQEVLSACLLLFLVRVLVNRLATMLPAPPGVRSAGLVPAAEEAAAAAKAAGLAPPVANGGAVAAGGGLGPLAAAALATGAVSSSNRHFLCANQHGVSDACVFHDQTARLASCAVARRALTQPTQP